MTAVASVEEADARSAARWQEAMLAGRFEEAWRESDAIRHRGSPDPHRFWNGEDLHGARVIVRCLHGLGDAVQMLRYAPRLSEIAASVIYEAPPRLLPLMPCFRGVREAVTWGEQTPGEPPAWDVQVEVMELPYVFRTTVEQLPLAVKYLELPERLVRSAARSMGPKPCTRVGLVWACGEWNPERAVPLPLLGGLLQQRGVEFWSLQGGAAAAEAEGLPLRDATDVCGDGLLALAATIANLDLVITPDTLAAHLAGALGKPAWVMLQHAADWRWMQEREDSPWYPTLRLFRQDSPGDWKTVVDNIAAKLGEFAGSKPLAALVG